MPLETVRTIAALRDRVFGWRGEGYPVTLVPTMGALHEGHLSLMRLAVERGRAGNDNSQGGKTVVTLFVNPTQFGPDEDFGVYPRDEAADASMMEAEGCDLLFAPDVEEMYADGFATKVSVPGIGDLLEGEFRPGFFDGVATVVAKLLIQAFPDAAIFGEKDYQQLQVIRRMALDLNLPVKIIGAPTVREADGLALSSRNAYLNEDERASAPALHRTLLAVAEGAATGDDLGALEREAEQALLNAGFAAVDYVTVRDAESLLPPGEGGGRPLRVLGAAKLGRARLIDNVAVS